MQTDGWKYKAHVLGVLPSENHNTADQLSPLAFIHHRDQAVAELHFNWLNRQQGVYIVDILIVITFTGRHLFRL